MRPFYNLSEEFIEALNEYKDWIFSESTQKALGTKLRVNEGPLFREKRGQHASSAEYLMSMDHENHSGLAVDEQGYNLNYSFLRQHAASIDPAFLEEIRAVSNRLDDKLQNLLGARACALKMFYPAGGFIGWHTNWDYGGYNMVFTYSQNGAGYWRHIDPTASQTVVPDPKKMVHIADVPGWHCKAGYYGKKSETDRLLWHSAYAPEPRITLGYVIGEKAIWENMVAELSDSSNGSANDSANTKAESPLARAF